MIPKITKNFKEASMAKQLPFAIARGLTQTAKDAQKDVLGSLGDYFTLRNNWSNPSNKFGIKIKAATKANLTAKVGTMADWMIIQEQGGNKKPRGNNLAIPTENVRRNKRDIITKANRPNALRGKNTFILQTKRGPVLFQRKFKGKRSQIVALYGLEKSAKIKKNSGIVEPALKSIRRNFNKNFINSLREAMKSAK